MGIRVIAFIAFALIAAPFEIELNWWAGYFQPDPELLEKPLAEAALYLYAFTLAAETLFRLQTYHSLFDHKPALKVIQILTGIAVVIFMYDYLGVLRPRLLYTGEPALDAWHRQVVASLTTLALSVISYYICERLPPSRKRAVETSAMG